MEVLKERFSSHYGFIFECELNVKYGKSTDARIVHLI
jgi:hypothetical protein